MSARDDWEAERIRLADEFHSVWPVGRPDPTSDAERERLSRAFDAYSKGTRAAWRAFFKAAPDEADEIFAENMLRVSGR